MWATNEIPLAQKEGSSLVPGICPRKASENSPYTVDTLTPTFSKTRPRITDITPPPPGPEFGSSFFALRVQAVCSNRPGGRSPCGPPTNSSSMISKEAQIRSRKVSNHAFASVLRFSILSMLDDSLSILSGQSTCLAKCLAKCQSRCGSQVKRARTLAHWQSQASCCRRMGNCWSPH